MAARHVLLIEWLDGLGAHEADASLRLRAMRDAGRSARALTLEPLPDRAPATAWREVAARIVAERPSEVWIAGAHASWQALTRVLPASLPCTWWPSIVPGSGDEPSTLDGAGIRLASGALEPTTALELAPVRLLRDRAPVALWDGDFVLALGSLEDVEGMRLLRAFAHAIAERPEMELVVLAEPDDRAAAAARSLGVAGRVHCAGPSPREAEHTWLATASAVLLPTSQPVSAGLVLRSLAAGAPLLFDPTERGARVLASWLEARGLPAPRPIDEALEAALARKPWVRAACSQGRAVAAQHDSATLAARLVARRGRGDGHAREAA